MGQKPTTRTRSLPPRARRRLGALRAGRFLLLACLLFLPANRAVMADDFDQQFLAGLRTRRLFSVAVRFCEQALAQPGLSDRERLEFALELARTHAQQAMNVLPAERAAHWKAASESLKKYRAEHNDNPRKVLLSVEAALLAGLEGELLVQEAELGANPADARQRARARLRTASKLLDKTEQEVNALQPVRRNVEGFTASEIAALRDHLRMRYASVWKNIALTYPSASDDRLNALTVAVERLEELRQELTPTEPLARRARLEEAACRRLLGGLDAAMRLLANFNTAPAALRLRARAEKVRILLAGKKLAEAVRAAEQSGLVVASPELDLARLEAYLAEWKVEQGRQDKTAAEARQKKIAATLKQIDQRHGVYWRRLADTRVRQMASSGGGASNVAILERTADDLYLRQQFDEAIGAYQQAATRAAESRQPDQAFMLWKKAALVEYQQSRFLEAGRRLKKLARKYQTNQQAAKTHLLAVYSLSRAAAKNGAAMSEYLAALEEHLELWSSHDTADQIRLWLGAMREHENRDHDAIALYRQVAAESPHFEAAVRGLARCWKRQLQASASSESREDLSRKAKAAAAFLEKLAAPDSVAEQTLKRFAALAAADLLLRFTNDNYAAAEKLLRNMPDATPDVGGQSAARIKLVWALAGQGAKRQQAEQILQQIADPAPEDLFALLEGLAAMNNQPDSNTKPDAAIARMVLQCASLLEAHLAKMPQSRHVRLMTHCAAAYGATGKNDAARRQYETLIDQHPRNAAVRNAYAEFLFDAPATRRAALAQWRILASKSRPQTGGWYRAKYDVARCYFALGEKERAAQFIRYLQAAPPGLEKTLLREQFLELLRRCEQ